MFFGFWVPCEILRVTNIELASFIPSSLYILNSQLLSRPHLIIGAPDLRRERALGQKISCLIRQLTESYLSFSEQAATSSQFLNSTSL